MIILTYFKVIRNWREDRKSLLNNYLLIFLFHTLSTMRYPSIIEFVTGITIPDRFALQRNK